MKTRFLWVSLVVVSAVHVFAQAESGSRVEKLRPHFMLGVGSAPGDGWIEETRKNGCRWDVRYQYICGGVNTPSNWKTWNQPAGAFLSLYLNESEKMGCIPCVTYYQLLQSLPAAGKGAEDVVNKTNGENGATMKAYFDDYKVLLQKCSEFGKPVIVHHEPDLWGYFLISQQFAPNEADKVKVIVKSSGHPDVAEFEDTAAGFGKAIVAMRDKYAPQVLLAWHASKWGNPDVNKFVAFLKQCGKWDLLFTDPSDRDSAWKIAKNYHAGGAWWTDADFNSFRDWSAELHKATKLPLMAWQIPMGNTVFASCNNTDGHYMDNRPEYWLENYPQNTHIAEYAAAGYIGLLFGGGAGACTNCRDVYKDGVTNPEPVKGNKGEKSAWPDDDGGYLRLRGGNYYTKGPLLFKQQNKAAVVAAPAPKPVEAPKITVNEKLLAEYQGKLIQRVNELAKAGKKPSVFLRLTDKQEKFNVRSADEKELTIEVQGNPMPVSWKKIEMRDRVALAKANASEEDAEAMMLVAVLLCADGDVSAAQEFLAKAALKDADKAAAVKTALGL
ncbi:MAG TPA: hypothetical protein VEJ63_22005 [Planctomycetota bacterium]|nr:hypothetical protein [Planctomycetota bacterium]